MSDPSIEDLGFTPVSKAPSQFSFNGIGTKLYGNSKVENSDDLYTRVMYFTILFVPILALGKYLVQQHDGNEYILGKGKLSGISKGWNYALVVCLTVFASYAFYQKHINSPEYIAANLYQEAIELIKDKNYTAATKNLILVYNGRTSVVNQAKTQLLQLADPQSLKNNSPNEVLNIIKGIEPLKSLFPTDIESYKSYHSKFETGFPGIASEFAELVIKYSKDESVIQLYNNKNYQLLKQIYQKEKDNFAIATKYALLEERLNKCLECINILEPHKTKLGRTEAARILGQAYAQTHQIELAYELLFPYVQTRINTYHRAEEKYNQVVNKVWDDAVNYLNSGKASSTFYSRYDESTEEQQRQMVDEFYIERRDASVAVANAKENYINSTSIVPVALDLGVVFLNRALTLSDPEEREKSLKQAEETFLSVQNYAGDSDDYQLYLGQVYYWLGKEEKGDGLFTALLDKYERDHQVLSSLSRTLRELGAFSKAKEYALEAYEKAPAGEYKFAYSQSLALLSDELAEKIEWLEKADQSNPYVKGDLLTAKGRKAASENNKAQALKLFQQSIQIYQKIPEDATQLNNIALIYISKYRIGFEQDDYVKGLEYLDRAVALVPEDSIVLSNAAYQHLEKAYFDVLSPYINFKALEMSPTLDFFSYLYKSQVEKNQFISKLAKHSSFNKALSYMQKAVLLAPKNVSTLSELYSLYIFMDKKEELSQLATRFKTIEPDLQGQRKRISDYRSGKNKEKNLKDISDYLVIIEETIKNNENKNHPLNQTILASKLLEMQLNSIAYGKRYKSVQLLNQARLNYKLNKASSLRGDLELALIHHLLIKASTKLSNFDEFYQQYKVVLDDRSILGIALSDDNKFYELVMGSTEKKELESLIVEGFNSFPEFPRITNWKILKLLGNSEANKIKNALVNNSTQDDKDSLSYKITANQEYIALNKIFKLELEGNVSEANKLNDDVISNGLLLPNFEH